MTSNLNRNRFDKYNRIGFHCMEKFYSNRSSTNIYTFKSIKNSQCLGSTGKEKWVQFASPAGSAAYNSDEARGQGEKTRSKLSHCNNSTFEYCLVALQELCKFLRSSKGERKMANLEIYKFDHVVSFFNLFHIEHNFTKKQLIIINVGFDYLRCQRMSSSVKERSENSQRQL